jgi:molybdopterin-guanine dinucleotide biosynthesis protein A
MFGVLILAGGTGRRFGGNKALMKLGGKPLLLHMVEGVWGFAREIVVAIGKDDEPDDYRRFLSSEVTIRKDAAAKRGPLTGILAGMRGMRSEYTLVLPCDSPFIRGGVLKYLFDKARNADAAIPRWPNGYIEPLHAVYKVSSAFSAAENAMETRKLSIRDMIAGLHKVVYVGTDEIRRLDPQLLTFYNINSQEELRTAVKMFRSLTI